MTDPTDAQIAAALDRVADFRASFEDGEICEQSRMTTADLDLLLSIARAQRLIRVKDLGEAAG